MGDLPRNPHRPFHRRIPAVLLLLFLLLWWAPAQAAADQPAPSQDAANEASRRAEKKDHHITPAEAQELFRSVDTILKFDSDDTGLPIHHPVKRELTSRDQVEQYIRKQLDDDKETKRLRRSEAVLKKFGLLPRSYNLEDLLISVLREQVAGYYDPKSQTFYLLDWIAPEEQKGVIAHELTHALQDQTIHLEKWLKDDDISDLSAKDLDKRDQKEQSISQDEVGTARQAVIEGQATAVFLDYFLSKAGRSIRTDPEQVYVFQQAMMDSGNTPVFRDAPLYMKEALAFPYKYGIAFEEQLLLNGGRKRAFEEALKDPPRTTRNIMEPKTYLDHEKIPPVRLPAMKPLLGDKYERFDLDSVGEFDVYVILKQFASEGFADNISKQWRGGAYYAARKLDYQPPPPAAAPVAAPASAGGNDEAKKPDDKSSGSKPADAKIAENQATPPEALALMYVSRWGTPQAAQKFANAYALALPKRYKDVSKAEPAAVPATFAERVASHTKWNTSEGPVFIESWGQYVLVMEGFDADTAARVRDAFLAEREPDAE